MKKSYAFGKPIQDVLYERRKEFDKKQIESVYGTSIESYNKILDDIINDVFTIGSSQEKSNFIIWY